MLVVCALVQIQSCIRSAGCFLLVVCVFRHINSVLKALVVFTFRHNHVLKVLVVYAFRHNDVLEVLVVFTFRHTDVL